MRNTTPAPSNKGIAQIASAQLFGNDVLASGETVRRVAEAVQTEEIDVVEDVDMQVLTNPNGSREYTYYVKGRQVADDGGRFSTSILGHIGAPKSNLKWIEYKEMADRILTAELAEKGEKAKGRKLHLTYLDGMTVEGKESDHKHVFAATRDHQTPILDIIDRLDSDTAFIGRDGILTFAARPNGEKSVSILGDRYNMHNYLQVPIDGYGQARRILGNVRSACANGMILWGEKFSAKIKNSNDYMSSLYMSLRSVSDEHVKIFNERMGAASVTPISAFEFRSLVVALIQDRKLHTKNRSLSGEDRVNDNTLWFDLMQELGDVALPESVDWSKVLESEPEMLTPVKCRTTVTDTINMFTEIATHRLNPSSGLSGKPLLGQAIGSLMSKRRFNLQGAKVESLNKDFWFDGSAEVAELALSN